MSSDLAKKALKDLDDLTAAWEEALSGTVENQRGAVLAEFEKLLNRLGHLPTGTGKPDNRDATPKNAALHYRMANLILQVFARSSGRPQVFTRGMLFDMWDAWWTAVTGLPHWRTTRRISEHFAQNSGLARRVVQPELVRDAIAAIDRELTVSLGGKRGIGGERVLIEQIVWQMLRLHATQNFDIEDRTVLYELLRMRHLRFSDRKVGFVPKSLSVMHDAVDLTLLALAGKAPSMPHASESAFSTTDNQPLIGGPDDKERELAVAAIQFIVSASINKLTLEQAASRAVDAAVTLKMRQERLDSVELRRLVMRLASRSRMVRMALDDLLDERFPLAVGRPVVPRATATLGDCWISVVGHRTTGKSYFMASLTAALLPPETELEGGKTGGAKFWRQGRVRLLESSAFENSPGRTGVEEKAFEGQVVTKLLSKWAAQEPIERTADSFSQIAEVDAPYMARFCFFDFAGEHIIDAARGELDVEIAPVLQQLDPAASVIMDCDEDDTNERHRTSNYKGYASLIAGKDAPIYIVINKFDEILKHGNYSPEAREELLRSVDFSDTPKMFDADFDGGWLPFFSLRDMAIGDIQPSFDDLLEHIDAAPSLARRPYFQHRLRHDLQRLRLLIEALLETGRRDISVLYLVAARDGRGTSKDLKGIRVLWADLENRVLAATADARWSAVRRLLVDEPTRYETAATAAYGRLDPMFRCLVPRLKDVASPTVPAKGEPVDLPDASLKDWSTFYGDVATYREVTGLQSAWTTASRAIDARRNLADGLSDAILTLLPEVGIDPQAPFASRDFDALRTPIGAVAKALNLDKVVESVATALAKDGLYQDWLKERLKDVIRDVASNGRIENGVTPAEFKSAPGEHEPGVETTFNLREGAKPPLGPAGAPASEARLTFAERDALLGVKGLFGERILDRGRSPEQAVFLARALRNLSPDARYSHLVLKVGERDFNRVRVLTEKGELRDDLDDFLISAFDLLRDLQEVRWSLDQIDDAILADWIMANALHAALPELGGVRFEEIIAATDSKPFDDLTKLAIQAANLKNLIEGAQKADRQKIMGGTFLSLAGAFGNVRSQDVMLWQRLLPEAEQALKTWELTRSWNGPERPAIEAVPKTLGEVLELLNKLVETVGRLRGADTTKLAAVRAFHEDPLGEARTGRGPDGYRPGGGDVMLTQLRPRLISLRLKRRRLIISYALRMMNMGGWTKAARTILAQEPGRKPNPFIEAQHHLERAVEAVNSNFKKLFAQHAAELDGESVGKPSFDAFEVGDGRAAMIKNDDYVALVRALQLADESVPGGSTLWKPKS